MTDKLSPLVANEFPYEQLLAFYRDELFDATQRDRMENLVRSDERWKTHWESLDHLDLERAAAIQDGRDLEHFSAVDATDYCRAVADSGGRIFDAFWQGDTEADSNGLWTRRQWSRHVDECVYCRRMRRAAHARGVSARVKIPRDEPLLRDWLLAEYYAGALQRATERIAASAQVRLERPVRLVLAAGDFVAIGENPGGDLSATPSGIVNGWRYASQLAAQSHLALLHEGDRTVLTLERELKADLGWLCLTLCVAQDGTVRCEVQFVRPDNQPRWNRTLLVEHQGIPLVFVSGDAHALANTATLPATDFLPGTRIRIRVSEKPESPALEELTVRFEERL
jgi:hypothetical protein